MSDLPNESTHVELPLIEQLKGMDWQHITGDIDVPDFTERANFGEVLLHDRLRAALRRINTDDNGLPWLDDIRLLQAINALERLGAGKLMEANRRVTDLLLTGITVEGDPSHPGVSARDQLVRFIDFDHPERNDFLVINQFRVDVPGGQTFIVPDIVLFVNGIPLVVIECKSPAATDPMEAAITQLLRYSNQRAWVEADEGAERLFHYNLFLLATDFYEARAAPVGASYEQYLEWKDTSPVPRTQVAADLGVEKLSSQQMLVAGMLRPAHLLALLRSFTLFTTSSGQTIKLVARYQQFRAVYAAIDRLQRGQTKRSHGLADQRGGIVWHTQGSGKSLTMTFLVRVLRTVPALRGFKVVVVTDRQDLENQLSVTAALSGETVRRARNSEDLKRILREDGPDLVFAMIQKYQEHDNEAKSSANHPKDEELYPLLNEDESILVLVDEAHRSQSSALHGNLLRALPNSARIGFTGTPIMLADRKRTQEIFGDFIDRYTIRQSEDDGATVPILYEGRTAQAVVSDGRSIDALFEDMFLERTPAEQEAIRRKYATTGNVLEAPKLIAAKAADILRHYVGTVLPNGLKAQVVASSRLAAVRYQAALVEAHRTLVAALDTLDSELLALDSESLAALDENTRFLVRAHTYRETIRRLKFAAIISGNRNDDPAWRQWSDESKVESHIARFKKPLSHVDPTRADGMAILCVKSMLLTGFDAPVEQALYLDRFMRGHELLQAIARVNRTYGEKTCGLVVDYYGVSNHLNQALKMYAVEDVQEALLNLLEDELPKLADRHRRVIAVFIDRGISDIFETESCIEMLSDVRARAAFKSALKSFTDSLDIVLPRPEALRYLRDARQLGFINKSASNRYRDNQMNLLGAGQKVRQLIDQYVEARGIDPKVPPISILDANFPKAVNEQPTLRAKASEMEHAARYHITVHYDDDPAYYKRLSERLELILQTFRDRWEELVSALREFTDDVRRGRPEDATGLDPKTQAPFLGILVEEVGGTVSSEHLQRLARITIDVVAHIQQEVRAIDFWRNLPAQGALRGWVVGYLDTHDVVPFERLPATADRIVDLAKRLHMRLVT